MKRKRKQEQQFQCYQLAVSQWWIGYSSSRINEEYNECLDLALNVVFLEPIRGVKTGHLVLYGSITEVSGFIQYDNNRILHGALWISFSGAAALLNVLTAGQQTILELYGKPFRYRSAAIRDIAWYTKGHPSIEEI